MAPTEPASTRKARSEQDRLAGMVRLIPLPDGIRFVAGADVSSAWHGNTLWGGLVVCDLEEGLRPVDSSVVRAEAEYPYIPGFLAFREVPVLLEAMALLRRRPDAILVDAHGTAHPRKFGCACHLGVLAGIPTVGCAKNLLCGEYSAPAAERGGSSPVLLDGEPAGIALRTRTGVREMFVSPGHLADLETSAVLALLCCPRFRIPVPILEAHRAVNEARRRCAEAS